MANNTNTSKGSGQRGSSYKKGNYSKSRQPNGKSYTGKGQQRNGAGQQGKNGHQAGNGQPGNSNHAHTYASARGPKVKSTYINNRPRRELDRNYLQRGSAEQKAMLENLSKEIARYDVKGIDYISDSIKWIDNKDKGESQVDMLNKMYSRYLIMECAKPIMHGRDANAVFDAMGIMIAGYLTNPEFKKTVNSAAQKVVYPYVKHKSDIAGPDSKWREWCDKIQADQNGGHLPLCGKSAAALCIAVDKKFYNAMREDGADIIKLNEQHQALRDQIYAVAEHDGVPKSEVDDNVRTLFGQMQGVDPTVSRMYSETAFEDVVRSKSREVKIKDDDGKEHTEYRWAGEFEHRKSGRGYTKGFTVRMPTHHFQWINRLNASMEDAFGRCQTAEDVFQFGRVINGENIGVKYQPGSPEYKRYSWMTEWQRKNQRDFDVMYDDCRNVKDVETLDQYIQDVTSAHFENWLRSHPKEAQKTAEHFGKGAGAGRDGAESGAVYDPAAAKQGSKPYIPPERRIEMPEELKDDKDYLQPVYGG